MRFWHIVLICYTTVLAFSSLYAPQPLFPVLKEHFGRGEEEVALLMTLTMLPLAVAPIAYGFLLEFFSAQRVLLLSIGVLAATQLAFALSSSFDLLLLLRFVQGLFLPAILTALLTYISHAGGERLSKIFSYYVASQIFGGMAGRVVSGTLATALGWRYSFVVLALSLVLNFFLLLILPRHVGFRVGKPGLSDITAALGQRRNLGYYVPVGGVFFIFVGLLNYLPFYLKEIDPGISEMVTGVMYFGFVMGIAVSLVSYRIRSALNSPKRAIYLGLLVYAVSLVFFATVSKAVVFAGVFVLAAGMFLIHSTASSCVNRLATERKGIVNGLYISVYYIGGTLGSILPGFVYKKLGWHALLAALGLMLALVVVAFAWINRHHTLPQDTP